MLVPLGYLSYDNRINEVFIPNKEIHLNINFFNSI